MLFVLLFTVYAPKWLQSALDYFLCTLQSSSWQLSLHYKCQALQAQGRENVTDISADWQANSLIFLLVSVFFPTILSVTLMHSVWLCFATIPFLNSRVIHFIIHFFSSLLHTQCQTLVADLPALYTFSIVKHRKPYLSCTTVQLIDKEKVQQKRKERIRQHFAPFSFVSLCYWNGKLKTNVECD